MVLSRKVHEHWTQYVHNHIELWLKQTFLWLLLSSHYTHCVYATVRYTLAHSKLKYKFTFRISHAPIRTDILLFFFSFSFCIHYSHFRVVFGRLCTCDKLSFNVVPIVSANRMHDVFNNSFRLLFSIKKNFVRFSCVGFIIVIISRSACRRSLHYILETHETHSTLLLLLLFIFFARRTVLWLRMRMKRKKEFETKMDWNESKKEKRKYVFC